MSAKSSSSAGPGSASQKADAGAPSGGSGATTHFGYQDVPLGEKRGRVQGVFESVASNYDLMNDLMSGGIHRLWKASMIDWLDPRPGQTFLDVAGGTGDIAFRIDERLSQAKDDVPVVLSGEDESDEGEEQRAPITVCDLTLGMLEVGRDRGLDRGILHSMDWVCGNAEALPFPDRSFDAYSIAFGLRNVTDIPAALAEAKRVLKPGGRFLCLEFSQVVIPAFASLYDLYSFKVLPAMGEAVAKDRASYQYLAESIRRFPPQEDLIALMNAAGLSMTSYRNLSGGIAALHSGWRI
ncbi:class I SAM-dependent methyltransferase [Denitrobaculum tricleocarpae]|uniref:Ubiquinone/menaquinone biosynthesis C-methyltransferase UbiE n=1 Tax=Denitrobaculum tricleocarpae TaxID=2591009 RepID=A0A545TGU2_9PROT|nr:class I SAM-dependent methyltransferase [Denitrobaculum tricleocarpae]TQV76351.1 class I SAM-dependent methyltransferase [Denitrobaculum tricleocarpae]